jgi:pyrimidine oxygenase
MVKWRGFGGETKHWDYSLESFTLMAACAAVTSRIQLYASVAIPTIHPGVIAKMAATIDDISKGRFGVNIVSGWNKMEYAQMGLWRGDEYFKRRYEYAAEYLDVLRKLWRQERVTYHSDSFDFDDCKSYPKPSRDIPIICAGQSDRGIAFTSQYADFGFLGGQDDTLDDLGRLNGKLQASARGFRRKVGAYVLLTVIAEETDEKAFAKRDFYIETSDKPAMAEWGRGSRAWTFPARPTRTSRSRPLWPSPTSRARTRPWPIISTVSPKTDWRACVSSFPTTRTTSSVWSTTSCPG